ncbi:hypothetical protein [Halobacillus amylolyticus]|uniref:Helicase HerA central domain-containing protein n=1 Tax=Halobacillus amylolyticus TaxID=2932259 RepID=A0ABY4HKM4_9BACI|nr:hypothetical protein [Halobacillus amylolyticus]UOR14075.1 hypothetical protein MUO15_21200 [Halobacillus amylolyticus]
MKQQIIGKTGSGKSVMLRKRALHDANKGLNVVFVDGIEGYSNHQRNLYIKELIEYQDHNLNILTIDEFINEYARIKSCDRLYMDHVSKDMLGESLFQDTLDLIQSKNDGFQNVCAVVYGEGSDHYLLDGFVPIQTVIRV